MSQDGKDTGDKPSRVQPSSEAAEDTTSLPRRIGASTAGLLQSSFGHPLAGYAAGPLTSLNPGGAKGSSSSSSAHFDEASLSTHSSSAYGERNTKKELTSESFRSERGRSWEGEKAQVAFDDFVKGSQEALSTPLKPQEPLPLTGRQQVSCPGLDEKYYVPLVEHHSGLRQKFEDFNGHKNSNGDGAAVVALLSNPKIEIDEEPTNSWAFGKSQDGEDYHGTVQKAQHPHSPHNVTNPPGAQTATNPLALIPDFCSLWGPNYSAGYGEGRDRRLGLEVIPDTNVGEGQPWIDVLHRYQDEVWGDMLPLVQEARKELKIATASDKGASQERPALRRLAMLLRHLKYPTG